jgi:hypothetical protein
MVMFISVHSTHIVENLDVVNPSCEWQCGYHQPGNEAEYAMAWFLRRTPFGTKASHL